MISSGHRAASARATAVLPTAVGPTRTGTLPPAKPSLQLLAGKLYDRRPAVHVVWRQVGREQPPQQLAHLGRLQPLARLDGRPAGVRRREPLETVGPAAEPAARQ